MWITRQLKNMIFLWWLAIEASFGEVVWGAPFLLCVMFGKDGITMDWSHKIVVEMLIFVWCVDELMCLVDCRPVPLAGAHTDLQKTISMGNVVEDSTLKSGGWLQSDIRGMLVGLLFLWGVVLSLWSCIHKVGKSLSLYHDDGVISIVIQLKMCKTTKLWKFQWQRAHDVIN